MSKLFKIISAILAFFIFFNSAVIDAYEDNLVVRVRNFVTHELTDYEYSFDI